MYCRSGSSAASCATSRKNAPTPVGRPSRYANTASALQSRIRGMLIIVDAGNDCLAGRSCRHKHAQNLSPLSGTARIRVFIGRAGAGRAAGSQENGPQQIVVKCTDHSDLRKSMRHVSATEAKQKPAALVDESQRGAGMIRLG